MVQFHLSSCPICDSPGVQIDHKMEIGKLRISCDRCGIYELAREYARLESKPWSEVRHLVSAWIRRANKAQMVNPDPTLGAELRDVISGEWWISQFSRMGFPQTTSEKLDRLLVTYSESIKGDYNGQITLKQPYFVAEVAAMNQNEADGLNRLLEELEYFDKVTHRITAKGWMRIQEIERDTINSNSSFIAMWFSDMTKKYREASIAAVEYCGYKAIVVDQQEYNDFIMNQVISLIRQSRFLVADFTCRPETKNDGKVMNGVRGGVYWEAGMAYGLGRPVIHTCEDSIDSKSRIHFDVNQYNTIFWKEEELSTEIHPLDQPRTNPNFAEKLAVRILATVGKGNSSSAK